MSDLLPRIRALERISRRLEPDAAGRREISDPVFAYAGEFLDEVNRLPAFRWEEAPPPDAAEPAFAEEPWDVRAVLERIRRRVDGPGLNPASGGHLAYIPGGGIYPAALGDYLAAVTNRYAGVAFAGPGAVRLERGLIRWMADLLGFPADAAGDLTSGGSIANLIGVVCAREAAELRARDFHRAVVYRTRHVHHSVDKALRIAGLGEAVFREVEVDGFYRMRPDALETAIRTDLRAGRVPWLVVGSAGTTDTGAIDPMEEIGEVARANRLWFHVDAAYGGFFRLCADGGTLLRGIDRADSVVMDPHKGLFLPYGSGAVVERDREVLRRAHSYAADYLQDARRGEEEFSPADHSPELTRHFRGLRLWLPLRLFGLAPFRACLEEKRLLTRYFHEAIGRAPGFEAGPPPELSVAVYRYLPRRGDPDEFNRRLIRAIQEDGRVFLSSTRLDGRFVLRLAVLSFRTHLDTIDTALDLLAREAKQLEADS
ncbi:MAG: amino acid decarboxylase [Acidobacteria bacterium]|nr:amino acid decarboxylase [Acidobacteriota bacterium]